MSESVKQIKVLTIPHEDQIYDTMGDYSFEDGDLLILTSAMPDWRMSIACALHEMIESCLMLQDGVPLQASTDFDIPYEEARTKGIAAPCGCVPTEDSEPGEDQHAPYRSQHMFADAVERLFCERIGIPWAIYSEAGAALDYPSKEDSANIGPT